jgi:hypothetical protein
MAQQHPPGNGQHHAILGAVEKSGADAFFEARQLLRQRRLRETEELAGSRQRFRLRDGEEDAKLMKGHGQSRCAIWETLAVSP